MSKLKNHPLRLSDFKWDNLSGLPTSTDIAVIGMSVRTAFANNVDEFWKNLTNGKDCIHEIPDSIPVAVAGNLSSIVPSRISYFLDLKGPAVLVDTACSSSLVAVHLACQGIRNGDCQQAIAGGVRINLVPIAHKTTIGIESSDGKTKTFSDDSDGTGVGEGSAAVLLKPLDNAIKDNDNIYAVIKGSAVNQDGQSLGITAPSVEAQTRVIIKVQKTPPYDPF